MPILEIRYSRLGRQIRSRLLALGRDRSMSIMVWQVLRKLPKPLILVLSLFLLAAIARA